MWLPPSISDAVGMVPWEVAYTVDSVCTFQGRQTLCTAVRATHLASKSNLVGLLLATLRLKALLKLFNHGLQSCCAAVMLSYAAVPGCNDYSQVINGLVQGLDPESLNISQLNLHSLFFRFQSAATL